MIMHLVMSIIAYVMAVKFGSNMYDNVRLDDIWDIAAKCSTTVLLVIFGSIFLHLYMYPVEECECDNEKKEFVIEIENNKIKNIYKYD